MARDFQNDGYSGLLRKVAGVDLFAAEVHFHQPCYFIFYSKDQIWKGYHKSSNGDENVDFEMLAAHAIAYESMNPNPHFLSKMLIKKIEKDESILQLMLFSKVS